MQKIILSSSHGTMLPQLKSCQNMLRRNHSRWSVTPTLSSTTAGATSTSFKLDQHQHHQQHQQRFSFGTLTHFEISPLSDNSSSSAVITTPTMVDIGNKPDTVRTAVAEARVLLPPDVRNKLLPFSFTSSSSSVSNTETALYSTAVTAGIMAAKRTWELIPMCHPLQLSKCSVQIHAMERREEEEVVVDASSSSSSSSTVLRVVCTVSTKGSTGVEMEALTGASVAALTLYDMLKSSGKGIIIEQVRLLEKTGGKHGDFKAKGRGIYTY